MESVGREILLTDLENVQSTQSACLTIVPIESGRCGPSARWKARAAQKRFTGLAIVSLDHWP